LAAEVGMMVFGIAYARWSTAGKASPFGRLADAALTELRMNATILGVEPNAKASVPPAR
jgi:hypothetical protein